MEQLDQRVEVAIARGREERIDDASLSCRVSVGLRRSPTRRRARLASCRVAGSERPSTSAIS